MRLEAAREQRPEGLGIKLLAAKLGRAQTSQKSTVTTLRCSRDAGAARDSTARVTEASALAVLSAALQADHRPRYDWPPRTSARRY